MRSRYRLNRRRRPVLGALALFCLLFQQLVMAAYACPLQAAAKVDGMEAACAARMGLVASAGNDAHRADSHRADPRCNEHCSSQVASTANAAEPSVPPLLWPAEVLLAARIVAAEPTPMLPEVDTRVVDPPPSLRFCSLLI